MQDRYRLLDSLKQKIDVFFDEETNSDNELGWLPENISLRMAEAAFAVLENNKELNDYLEKQGLIKD